MSDNWGDGPSNDWNNDGQNRSQNSRGNDRRDYNNDRNNYPQKREFRPSRDNYNRREDNEDEMTIPLPQGMIGKVIGRGGAMIRELQDKSGATIHVDKSVEYNGESTVRLSGPIDAQKSAKELIEKLIEKTDQPPPQRQWQPRQQQQQQQQYSGNRNESSSRSTPMEQEKKESDPLDFTDFDWTKANEEHQVYQKQRWADLKPLVKVFYKELPEITNMSKEEVAKIREEKNKIECRYVFEQENGEEISVPNPVLTFHQAFHNYPEILEEIKKQGFQNPSPIQSQAWPILMSGKDLIGIAQTGTGKTLAFLLPALIHIDGQPTPREERVGPNILIMAPTRELAQQINKEASKYHYRGIKTVCVFGGGDRKSQIDTVSKGVQIVIATPGRLNDLVAAGALNVGDVTYLVLDEADRMLDMGFEPQIRKTLLDVRPDRQTVMTSATWPAGVRRLAQSYMKDPVQVSIGSLDLTAAHSVRQIIRIVTDEEKTDHLLEFFRSMGENDKVIVFFGKKATVDNIASDLAIANVDCQSMHGGRDQSDREQALEDIRDGGVKILLATDLASRGLDVCNISHVFNYDFPKDIEEYVHRIGRTGRAGKTGEAISLITRGNWAIVGKLIKILEEASQEIPDQLYEMSDRYDAWRKRKDEEKETERVDCGRNFGRGRGGGGRGGGRGRGGGFGGGRRNDRW